MIAAERQAGTAQAAAARQAARLAAVQTLYQMELTGKDAETAAREFLAHGFASEREIAPSGKPDEAFFAAIVRGVPHHQVEIDRSIAGCLSEDWKLDRIDSILRAILRAGAFELIGRKDVPAKVVIDQYVDVAHAFFSAQEPAFVNAALDRLARQKRSREFGEAPSGGELEF